jgi:hypothetical protein
MIRTPPNMADDQFLERHTSVSIKSCIVPKGVNEHVFNGYREVQRPSVEEKHG